MSSNFTCRKCGNKLTTFDRFCGMCGTATESIAISAPISEERHEIKRPHDATSLQCRLCGQENHSGVVSCESCGNVLNVEPQQSLSSQRPKGYSSQAVPVSFLQSWKLTVTMAVLLITVLILFNAFRKDGQTHSPELSPNASAIINEIESLQKVVEENPQNAEALLTLANRLHDVRFFPRAIAMYERYLQLDPTNADARVDLGTTYFEMSMIDTVKKNDFLRSAKSEMEKALTHAPRHQLAHFNLGIVSLHEGDLKGSSEWFEKCVSIDSTTESAKRARQLIHQHSFTNPL